MLRDICPLFTGNTFAIYMLLVVCYHVSFLLHGVQEKDWGIQGVRISTQMVMGLDGSLGEVM